jgi:hypothetical protein
VKTYILTVQIEAEDDMTPESVREAVYRATDHVPFSLDIIGTEEI